MPLSLLSIFLGVVLGVLASAIAWGLLQRPVRNPEATQLTAVWRLADIVAPGTRPAILAQRLEGQGLPAGTKLVVQRDALDAVDAQTLASCEVRVHPDVRVNAAIGRDRALVFSGPVSPRATTVFTLDAGIVGRLQADFERLWREAEPYVERTRVSELSGKEGRIVEVTGRAAEVMEFRGRRMLRVSDGKAAVGVVTTQGDVADHQGSVVRVTGRLLREQNVPYIEATAIAPAEAAPLVA